MDRNRVESGVYPGRIAVGLCHRPCPRRCLPCSTASALPEARIAFIDCTPRAPESMKPARRDRALIQYLRPGLVTIMLVPQTRSKTAFNMLLEIISVWLQLSKRLFPVPQRPALRGQNTILQPTLIVIGGRWGCGGVAHVFTPALSADALHVAV